MKSAGALFSKVAESLHRIRVRWLAAAALLMAVTFTAGYTLGDKDPPPPSFHDMIVNHTDGHSSLVTPDDRRVRARAKELKTSRNAYLYLRDPIAFDPSLPVEPAGVIAGQKRASCLGKAVLLSSIYLAMGHDQFKGMAYTNAFIKRENYTFNDKGFAVVSRLNMMKGSGHPVITKGLQ